MGSVGRRLRRLECHAGLDAATERDADREARDLMTEALKRVSDEDLGIMGDFAKQARRRGEGGMEWAEALKGHHPELWGRFEDLYQETEEELAHGR